MPELRDRIAKLIHQQWMVMLAGVWDDMGPECRMRWMPFTMSYSRMAKEHRADFEKSADQILELVRGEKDREVESGVRGRYTCKE